MADCRTARWAFEMRRSRRPCRLTHAQRSPIGPVGRRTSAGAVVGAAAAEAPCHTVLAVPGERMTGQQVQGGDTQDILLHLMQGAASLGQRCSTGAAVAADMEQAGTEAHEWHVRGSVRGALRTLVVDGTSFSHGADMQRAQVQSRGQPVPVAASAGGKVAPAGEEVVSKRMTWGIQCPRPRLSSADAVGAWGWHEGFGSPVMAPAAAEDKQAVVEDEERWLVVAEQHWAGERLRAVAVRERSAVDGQQVCPLRARPSRIGTSSSLQAR